MNLEEPRFAEGDLVRSERFGIGQVELDKGRIVIVHFDHGLEGCEKGTLTAVATPLQALNRARWAAPLRVVARSQAEAIRSINDTWGVFSRSRIALLPHQLWVCRRVLERWPARWLVADDVGLGKTIEAGLILWPLLAQRRVKRLLILCPASLVTQWQYRLREMFDIRLARYVSAADTERADFFAINDQVVASLQTLRTDHRGRVQRLLGNEAWDLLIVDEAHHLNANEHEKQTLGYKLVKQLVENEKVSSIVFFTGTPHRGKNYGFLSLLNLLRPDLFDPARPFEAQLPLLSQVMIRNNKQGVTDLTGRRLFQQPHVLKKTYRYAPAEAQFYTMLTEFIVTGKTYASSLDATRGKAVMLVLITMQKLASSSVAAIRRALEKRLAGLSVQREQMVERTDALVRQVSSFVTQHEQVAQSGDDEASADAEALISEFSDRLRGQLLLMEDEEQRLKELVNAARAVSGETKIAEIIAILETQFVDRQVLLFTEYKATQALIMSALLRRFGADCVAFINGDGRVEGVVDAAGIEHTWSEPREAAAERFNAGTVRFLVSTEAGGEGIDLQEGCYSLIHIDLPWNPMRLHQRVGRLNRYGQTKQVEVITLHNPDTVESRIWTKLNEKIELIMQAFSQVMDEPEDLMQLVLGMTSPSLFTEIFGDAVGISTDSLSGWFDQRTAQFGGKDAIAAVQELVGHCASFDYQRVAPDLPQLDLPALRPFLVVMLTLNNRNAQDDGRGLSFITPESWHSPGLRPSYVGLIFDRTDRSKDAHNRILGVGHKVIDLALDQALALEESVATIPRGRLERPLLICRVNDQVTGQGGTVRSAVVGVEGDPPERILRDWEVVERLNSVAEGLGRSRWAKESVPPEQIERVRAALQQAQHLVRDALGDLNLPFKVPSVEVLTILWPASSPLAIEAQETGATVPSGSDPADQAGSDITSRLLACVTSWPRTNTVTALHQRCRALAEPDAGALVPDRVLIVRDLNQDTLAMGVQPLWMRGLLPVLQFRVPPATPFDAALLPFAQEGDRCEQWVLVLEERLSPGEHIALYGHTLGHLLLNRDMCHMGQLPLLDPRDGYVHTDRLRDLRQPQRVHDPVDMRVLRAYPHLAALLAGGQRVAVEHPHDAPLRHDQRGGMA